MQQELYRDAYGLLTFESSRSLFCFRRTSVPYCLLEDVQRSFDGIYAALTTQQENRHGILLDLRQGPLRSDPAFEEVVKHHQQQIYDFTSRMAILVCSGLGVLQLMRQRREGWPLGLVFFDDEAKARAFLTEDPEPLLFDASSESLTQ